MGLANPPFHSAQISNPELQMASQLAHLDLLKINQQQNQVTTLPPGCLSCDGRTDGQVMAHKEPVFAERQ
jgi:hypothetical protein